VTGLEELLSDSFIIIDKPQGPTSHEVSAWVRRISGASRSGHAGTLDPNVSGVLPIALGRATKMLKYVAGRRKVYMGIARFRKELTLDEAKELFAKFAGKIRQLPPKMSAVKRRWRERRIYSLEPLEVEGKLVLFRADVEAGTYIRTLCVSLGKQVGGGRMEELRRVAVGRIGEDKAVTLQDFSDAVWAWKERGEEKYLRSMLIRPWELLGFRKIVVKKKAEENLLSGAQLAAPGVASVDEKIRADETVAIYSEDGKFIGVGRALCPAAEIKGKARGIVVQTERIHPERKE